MECPSCKSKDAYVGLSEVECVNTNCVYFNQDYLEKKLKESEISFSELIEEWGLGDELHNLLLEERFVEYDLAFSAWIQDLMGPNDE